MTRGDDMGRTEFITVLMLIQKMLEMGNTQAALEVINDAIAKAE